jgi:eukaryotic-like serine/threonine-protein kinase
MTQSAVMNLIRSIRAMTHLLDGIHLFSNQPSEDIHLDEKIAYTDLSRIYRGELNGHTAVFKIKSNTSNMEKAMVEETYNRALHAHSALPPHPNIVLFYGAKKAPEWGDCLAFEHIDGDTLEEVLTEHDVHKTKIEVQDALRVIEQSAIGLKHMHDYGFLHRDVKPNNIMITHTNEIKWIDLGLAVRFNEQGLFESNYCEGTIGFMAPETYSGTYNRSTDIFALGTIAWILFTGQEPYDCRCSTEKHIELLKTTKPEFPELPEYKNIYTSLKNCLERALHHDKRYGTLDTFLKDWRDIIQQYTSKKPEIN